VGYQGAGTVEFIVDASEGLRPDRFYFMEMNTRLQVEHPVTEAITGLDLVEWQLRVAAGQPLPLTQDQLKINGHAFEARIYAENPEKNFLPATGLLTHLQLPAGRARIDTGVRTGDRITPYYDPMIAKLIVHGPTRNAALNQLVAALSATRIAGCVTNIGFLTRLAQQPDFARGDVDTGLIERKTAPLTTPVEPSGEVIAIAALTAAGLLHQYDHNTPRSDPWDHYTGWRQWSEARQYVHLNGRDKLYEAQIVTRSNGAYEVSTAMATLAARLLTASADTVRIDFDGRIVTAGVLQDTTTVTVFYDAEAYRFELPDQLAEVDEDIAGSDRLIAPMPGVIRAIKVAAGDRVGKGDTLIVMEAMKMELTIAAPAGGTVKALHFAVGDQVTEGVELLEFESAD
jgi:3-methylcrotonyl-CoA carboxylase alpha subunit